MSTFEKATGENGGQDNESTRPLQPQGDESERELQPEEYTIQPRQKELNFPKGVAVTSDLEARRAEIREAYAGDLFRMTQELKKNGECFKAYPMKPPKGTAGIPTIADCHQNRHYFLSELFGEWDGKGIPRRPHLDTFRMVVVDHRGVEFDSYYSVGHLIACMAEARLPLQKLGDVRNSYEDYAMELSVNDMAIAFAARIPEWDGEQRMATRLIELFRPCDTPLTRRFGRYFWLSLYNRIMNPGCIAPIVLALIGAQNAGKSRFSDELCRIVVGPGSPAIPLDLSEMRNPTEFLRAITGHSIVGNIGEMIGLTRGDMTVINGFITKKGDSYRGLFKGSKDHERQWIIIMDGNKYAGIQRDDTGNRRFYPMFVGQNVDARGGPVFNDDDGQPTWDNNFEADFTDFDEKFWQVMAECRDLMSEIGMHGYNKLVHELVREVREFNADERAAGRGLVQDRTVDDNLQAAIIELAKGNSIKWRPGSKTVKMKDGNLIPSGVPIYAREVREAIEGMIEKGTKVNTLSVRERLFAYCKRRRDDNMEILELKLTDGKYASLFVPKKDDGRGTENWVEHVKTLLRGDEEGF